jgi:hypothetical protein
MASDNTPHDHHVIPQFFLRNFAVDEERTRITTVAKHGDVAVWAERSIKNIGYERDFYVHTARGRPVSVETDINRTVETPISRSDTWAKISSGRTDTLDRSDRAIIYALIRHLEARTPHFEQTGAELAAMAADPDSKISFTDEERQMYAVLRAQPALAKAMFNRMALTRFNEGEFDRSLIMIARSPVPLRTSTTPAVAAPAPAHPNSELPLPGMMPFQRALTLNPTTLALLVVGDFGGAFANEMMDAQMAADINRSFVLQFANFPKVRHLVSKRDGLIEDMRWARYELLKDTPGKITFRRRS